MSSSTKQKGTFLEETPKLTKEQENIILSQQDTVNSTFSPIDSSVPAEGIGQEDTVPSAAPSNQPQQQSGGGGVIENLPIFKEVKDVIVKVSQDHMNEIVEALKKDMLRLEYVDSKGKTQVDLKEYKPMTIGMNKQVAKVGKRIRLLQADINNMIKQVNGKDGKDKDKDREKILESRIEFIQKKYPDILDTDVDEYDLTNNQAFQEILLGYIYSQKASIYWGIDNIDSYSLHDIMIVSALYESRNNFSPSSSNTPSGR